MGADETGLGNARGRLEAVDVLREDALQFPFALEAGEKVVRRRRPDVARVQLVREAVEGLWVVEKVLQVKETLRVAVKETEVHPCHQVIDAIL